MAKLEDDNYRARVVGAINAFLQGDGSDVTTSDGGTKFYTKPGPRHETLVRALKESEELSIFENGIIRTDSGWSSTNLDLLVWWLVTIAFQNGDGAAAVEMLRSFLQGGSTACMRIVLLQGLLIDAPFRITANLHLLPTHLIPSASFRHELAAREARLAHVESLAKAPWEHGLTARVWTPTALVERITVPGTIFPIGPGEEFEKFLPELPRKDDYPLSEAAQAHRLLALVGMCSPVPVCQWTECEDWVPLKGFLGGFFVQPLHEALNREMKSLTASDLSILPDLMARFSRLPVQTKNMLNVSLDRLGASLRRYNLVDRAIDLGVAFEPLLLGQQKSEDGLAFPFRLRGAYLLGGEDIALRKHYMKLLNDVYTLRSRAVHGSPLQSDKEMKSKKLDPAQVIQDGTAACVKAIKTIIELGGIPDWNELILSGRTVAALAGAG